ncbi:hypothetical protein MNV49_005269 [Pseudohyphozyma bogoriensis]|nr:hypothetical protein MNV49_005269 [Pseudohyphozyma bogoriensis]
MGPPTAKKVVGRTGKSEYVSSLFTAEDLPAPATPAAPVMPTRPSNAPMVAPTPAAPTEPMDVDEDVPSVPAAPDLAPGLTALGLKTPIVNHLVTKMSITGPTATQAMAIPRLLSPTGGDAILRAQTGSGKTLAFLLPIVQDLLSLPASVLQTSTSTSSTTPDRSIGTLALILAPTRELASQTFDVLTLLLSSLPSNSTFSVSPRSLTPCLLVGGANRTHEKRRLRKGCPIVVATPGRLLDHLRTTECFRMAGEEAPKRGPRGRGTLPGAAAEEGASAAPTPGKGANSSALGTRGWAPGRKLGLRWLVVDECDRLMDLGFEEQMKGVLEELERRSPASGGNFRGKREGARRTVLCSATASEGVDRLAGMAMTDAVVLTPAGGAPLPKKADDGDYDEEREIEDAPLTTKETFTAPSQLVHNYVVVPPKLRFVSLVALLRRLLGKKGKGGKVLVFLSCTAAVDFYWEALGELDMGSNKVREKEVEETTNVLTVETNRDKAAKEKAKAEAEAAAEKTRLVSVSALLPNVPIYRLHGNLDLQARLGSLAAFSKKATVKSKGKEDGPGVETENAVLLCTSVAARGLDVSGVSHVIQYDLPTEGGVTEYVHRAGRTARAGAQGQATSLLLPSETEWVPWVEAGMNESSGASEKEIKMRQVGVEEVLSNGFGGEGREYETRATDVQMGFERWVAESDENASLARNAFASHIRAYATHPAAEKSMFNTKALHLGHLAKSFGMREAPGAAQKSSKKKAPRPDKQSQVGSREFAEKVLAGKSAGGFETGRRHDEERAKKSGAATLGVLYLVYLLLIAPQLSPLHDLPGPKADSLITGVAPSLLAAEPGMYQRHLAETYGGENRLLISDPVALNHVLVNNAYAFPKPSFIRGNLMRIMGKGILFAEGDDHRRQKRLLNPAFSPSHLKALAPLFYEQTYRVRDKWIQLIASNAIEDSFFKDEASVEAYRSQRHSTSEAEAVLDVSTWTARLTLEIIGLAGFGYSFGSFDSDGETSFATAFKALFFGMTKRPTPTMMLFMITLGRIVQSFPFIDRLPLPALRNVRQAFATMEDESRVIVEQAKKELLESGGSGIAERKDLMTLLLKSNMTATDPKQRMSDDELMGQMDRLRDEIRAARTKARNDGREELDPDELNSLEYLDAVTREILRFEPPVPMTLRHCAADSLIPLSSPLLTKSGKTHDSVFCPKGTVLAFSTHACNHSEKVFGEDAKVFRPERWLEGKVGEKVQGHGLYSQLLTFLSGPRGCIGYKFALLEFKAIVSVLIDEFAFAQRDVDGPAIEKRAEIVTKPFVVGEAELGLRMPLRITQVPR